MGSCCLATLVEVICQASFEPTIICNEFRPVGCNDRVLELLNYNSKDHFLSCINEDIIIRHFLPTNIKDQHTGKLRKSKIDEIGFALVLNDRSVKQTAVTKVKKWDLNDNTFYTISIKDIPVLKLANHELDCDYNDEELLSEFKSLNIKDNDICENLENNDIKDRLLSQFSQMADAVPSMIWVIGKQGDVHYQNLKVQETFGVNTVTEGWQECIHPEDISWFFPAWFEGMKSKKYFSLEVRYGNKAQVLNPNEESIFRWHFFQATPIMNSSGEVMKYIVNAVDIQDLKEAEAEKQRLAASEKMAMDASRLKSAFLSMMSHEIRTPLFGIVGNTCLLMDTDIDEYQKEYVDNIDGSAKLMMAVIQDILDFSRIEAGKLRLNSEPFSLNRLVLSFSKMVKQAALRKNLTFITEGLDTLQKVQGDSTRILQILTNLASNAIKFTKEGTVTIKFDHFIDSDNFLNLNVSIADTGIGIDPELIPKLFTPWVQGDSSNRRLYGGSGLGLAITKSLVDMMDGKISVASDINKGTDISFEVKLPSLDPEFDLNEQRSQTSSPMGEAKFEFYNLYESTGPLQTPALIVTDSKCDLPLPPSNTKTKRMVLSKTKLRNRTKSKATPSNNTNSAPGIEPIRKFRILLAEDNPINQAILKRFLDKMGCVEYYLAQDGVIALEEYLRHPLRYYQIVLLDQSMPRMDGDQVCKKIRELDPSQIVISVSANTLLSDRNHFLEIGMNDHISKPVTYSTFSQVLSRWMEVIDELYSTPITPTTLPVSNVSFSAAPPQAMAQT